MQFDSFIRNVLVVMSGTGLAQLLTFSVAPLLSRLYSPVDFGLFGAFVSGAGILSSVVTLQYSEAIMLPDDDRTAARLFLVSGVAAVGSTVLFSVICLAVQGPWLMAFSSPELAGWLWLMPVAALIAGLNHALTIWSARRKAFSQTAVSHVLRSAVAGTGQALAGFAGYGGGLIGGTLAGELASLAVLWRGIDLPGRALFRQELKVSELWRAAKTYRDFPIYSTPQYLANALSQGLPVLLLIFYFGSGVGGLYAFAVRVLQAPMNFILTSLRQVLFQQLTQVHHQRGDVIRLFETSTGILLVLSIVPAAAAWIILPRAFALVFGQQWLAAGEYGRWLLIWLVPGFCNVPANLLARILRKQRQLLLFDATLLGARLIALVLGGLCLSAVQTVALFSAVGGVFNATLILYVWRLAKTESASGAHLGGRPDPVSIFA